MQFKVYYAKDMMQGYKTPAFKASDYDEVALMDAFDLGDLFRQMNAVEGDEICVSMMLRSMSCGDVAVDMATGKAYFCAPIGWEQVTPSV